MPGSTSRAGSLAVLQHLPRMKVTKEIIHPFAELLHIGMLIGRALVTVDGDPLVHHPAGQVALSCRRDLHDQLLQITGKQEQPILVRQSSTTMSLAPRPLPAVEKYHTKASRAAGFSIVTGRRVAASIAAAPESKGHRRRGPEGRPAAGRQRKARRCGRRPNPTWGSGRASPRASAPVLSNFGSLLR